MIDVKIIKSNLTLAKQVIDYFAAEFANPQEFINIKNSAIKYSEKFNSRKGEMFINMGFLSPLECTLYIVDSGVANPGRVIDETLKALEEKLIIYSADKPTVEIVGQRYRLNGEYAANLYRSNLILNIILGFEYIIENYKNSVLKIEHICKNQTHSIGTGFLVRHNQQNLLITNKHVVENYEKLNIYDIIDNTIDFGVPFLHSKMDIAIIPIVTNIHSTTFKLNFSIRILSDIITIGYPSIPMTRLAYQVYHKGEINSFVEDYFKNNLFLISAKTSAGNSGSPVIDEFGTVVGIVTQELFEEEQFYKKGKLPYYAAITSIDIINAIQEFQNLDKN